MMRACCRSLISPTTTRSPITILSVSTAPPRRQRIDVGRLHPVFRRVAEDLRDAGTDGGTRYGEIDVDAEPGRIGIAVIGFQEQGAGARVAEARQGCGRILRRPHRLKAQE